MFPSYITPDFDFLQPSEDFVARSSKIDNYFLELLHLIFVTEANQYAD
jgi:hypothetical protein